MKRRRMHEQQNQPELKGVNVSQQLQPWDQQKQQKGLHQRNPNTFSNQWITKPESKAYLSSKRAMRGQSCQRRYHYGKQMEVRAFLAEESSKPQATNIDILKREIQFLQTEKVEECRWEKYPKPQALLTIKNYQRPATSQIKIQSIQRFMKESHPSFIIEGLTNTFTNSFFTKPLKDRPQTCQDKSWRRSTLRRSSHQKTQQIPKQSSAAKTDMFFKAIHSKIELIAPFKKYFQHNRNKQKKPVLLGMSKIEGRKIRKLTEYSTQNYISI